ncbi:MAG TPA: ribokinase [Phycisphaerales bacterium]|nr:ribokinase [Phycisphaerales bacterium]
MKGQASVCVVGSLNMDLVVRAPRIPHPGETLLGNTYRTFAGGKGANQAVAAARMLGGQGWVALVGCVGDDPHGAKLKAALEPEGVDLSRVLTRDPEMHPTGLALITVAEGGENTIVVSPGANASLTAGDVEAAKDTIAAAGVLLCQLEVPTTAIAAGVKIAKEAGRAVILNAAPARPLPPELIKQVDVLVVNKSEAAVMLAMDPSVDAARLALRLPDLGAPTVILTQGAHGAILAHKGRPRRMAAVPVHAVDSVGAGDAFCGALAAGWGEVHAAIKSKSHDEYRLVEEAVRIATIAGGLATTKAGALPSMPRRAEVDELAKKG